MKNNYTKAAAVVHSTTRRATEQADDAWKYTQEMGQRFADWFSTIEVPDWAQLGDQISTKAKGG